MLLEMRFELPGWKGMSCHACTSEQVSNSVVVIVIVIIVVIASSLSLSLRFNNMKKKEK